MIIIRMSGGLGNQMFQYALYLKLKKLGREVVFDDESQYDAETFRNSTQKRRPKCLNIFGIRYETARREDLERLTDGAMDLPSRFRRKLSGRKSLEKDDRDFVFDPSFLEVEEGYFCGGFQSPRYFAGAEKEVREAFSFPENLLEPKENSTRQEQKILAQSRGYAERLREANRAAAARAALKSGLPAARKVSTAFSTSTVPTPTCVPWGTGRSPFCSNIISQ